MTIYMDMNKQQKYPVQYIQPLRGGTAHVILFSDGKKYVVKWYGVTKGREKEVVNEYVVSMLAEILSLPIIPFDLVYIPEEFLKKTPELHSKKYNYHPGWHYGCVFVENCLVFEDVKLTPPSKEEVANRDMIAGLMVFDQWVNNSDRGTMNVILEPVQGSYYVHMIDHGRVFPGRYQWSAKTFLEQPVYNFHWPFYKWSYTLLHNDNELISFMDRILHFPNEYIFKVIDSIPAEWQVSVEDKEALYQFLLKQKDDLPTIVADMIDYHHNFLNRSISTHEQNQLDFP